MRVRRDTDPTFAPGNVAALRGSDAKLSARKADSACRGHLHAGLDVAKPNRRIKPLRSVPNIQCRHRKMERL